MQAQRHLQIDPGHDSSGFEHVVMEAASDAGAAAGADDGAALATHYLDSPFHGYTTELSLLAGHYLRVRCSQADGSCGDYSFDLAFLGSSHTCNRHIPWPGFSLVAGLALAGVAVMALAWSHHGEWRHPFLAGLAGFLLVALGVFTAASFLRRTTETLELRSLHGRAPLARLTGGLGSARRHTSLVCDLAKGARAARAARPRSHRQFLREEMQAHHGLHQSGVISAGEYESSKARILAAHDQAGDPRD